MHDVIAFFIITFVIAFLARPASRALHMPALAVYLVGGILLALAGFGGRLETNAVGYFLGFGIILIMFSAGLELRIDRLRKASRGAIAFALAGSVPSFVVGTVIALKIGVAGEGGHEAWLAAPAMGMIFATTSVGAVTGLFREFSGVHDRRMATLGRTATAGTVLADIVSLVGLAAIVSFTRSGGSLAAFALLAGVFLAGLFLVLPKIGWRLFTGRGRGEVHGEQTRNVILVMLLCVALAELARIHAIAGAFLVGLALANVTLGSATSHNLRFLTFGIFVPICFVTVGASSDIRGFFLEGRWMTALYLGGGLIASKLAAGFLVSWRMGYTKRQAAGVGFALIPQGTATLSAALAAKEVGLISGEALQAVIVIALVTMVAGPFLAKRLLFGKVKRRTTERVEDYVDRTVEAIPAGARLSAVLAVAAGEDLENYPIATSDGVYKGCVNLHEFHELVFDATLDNLITATDLATNKVPTVAAGATVEEGLEVLRSNGLAAAPVIVELEEGNVYVGILRRRDLLRAHGRLMLAKRGENRDEKEATEGADRKRG